MHSPASFTVEKPRAKFFLYGAVNAVLFVVLMVLFYGIGRVLQDIAATKRETETLSLVVSQIAALRDTSRVADAAFLELRQILPDIDRMLFISTELETIARLRGVQFGFQYGSVDEGPPRAILFTMSLEGPLPSMASYLEALGQELPYIIQISNIDIVSASDGRYRTVMSGRLFIR